jgi:hypothetical protein
MITEANKQRVLKILEPFKVRVVHGKDYQRLVLLLAQELGAAEERGVDGFAQYLAETWKEGRRP